MGRTIGAILIAVGLVWCGVVSAITGAGFAGGQVYSPAALVFGIGLFGVVPMLLFVGIGVFLLWKGTQEAAELADAQKKERLLGMIQSAGKISIGKAAIEMKLTRDQIKDMIFELVNQGLFSGYVDWKEGVFYSRDVAQVQTTKCPNCGGEREAVGKGLVKCPYCGVELFLPQE